MNIFSKLRSLYPVDSPVIIEDEDGNVLSSFDIADHSYESNLQVLKKAYDDKDKLVQDFDEADDEFDKQLAACDTALEKAEGKEEATILKTNIITKKQKAEDAFINKSKRLDKAINKASSNVLEAHDRYFNEAAEMIAGSTIEQQAIVKSVIDEWNQGKLELTHKEAISKAMIEADLIRVSKNEVKDSIQKASNSNYSAVIVKDSQTRILMLQRNDDSKQWMLPGGHIDEGESPIQAAVRELKEETNLEIPSRFTYDCGAHDIDGGKKVHLFLAYSADNISQSPLANIDSQNEAIQFKWMSSDEWLAADLYKDTKEQMKKVLIPVAQVIK